MVKELRRVLPVELAYRIIPFLLLCPGCSARELRVPISNVEMLRVVKEYRDQGETRLQHEDGPLMLSKYSNPTLSLCYRVPPDDSGRPQAIRDKRLTVPLHLVRVADERLVVDGLSFPVSNVDEAAVHLLDAETARDLARPQPGQAGNRWGYGFTAGGPAYLLGFSLDIRATRWLGLEAGGLPMAVAFAAVRVGPISLGRFTPFVGGFYNIVGAADDNSSNARTCAGGRVGAAWAVRRDLEVRAEFDLCQAREEKDGETGRSFLSPWAGLAVSSW